MRKIYVLLKNFLKNLEQFLNLKNNKWKIVFNYDLSVSINIPKYNLFSIIFDYHTISIINKFVDSKNKEPLLRIILANIVKNFINKDSIIIDIGAWVGDNSIPWAINLGNDGEIVAIDPSSKNIKNIESFKKTNNIKNIITFQAVCSNEHGQELSFTGDINHARFNDMSDKKSNQILSTTLDRIISTSGIDKLVSIIHLDVEGFELRVLQGAMSILEDDPILVFEVHISQQDYSELFKFVRGINYKIYMINEVWSGTDLDCRNFLAFNENNILLNEFLMSLNVKDNQISSGCIGPHIIEIKD